jgi:hypothetical protein
MYINIAATIIVTIYCIAISTAAAVVSQAQTNLHFPLSLIFYYFYAIFAEK